MRMNRRILHLAFAAAVAFAVGAAASPLPDGRFYLFLDEPEATLDCLGIRSLFCLERNGGQWAPVFSGVGCGIPFGLVRKDGTDGDFAEADCLVLYFGEGRKKVLAGIPEGSVLVEYALRVKLEDSTRVVGSWRASHAFPAVDRGQARGSKEPKSEGVLTGMFVPARPTGRTPAASGEHPRFLMRREDLPALKRKFATDWGKAMAARLDKEDTSRSSSAVGLGLLYQLTGNREYAERAGKLVMQDLDSGWWTPVWGIHDPGWKAVEGMYAYDLVYDVCDAAYRAKMRRALRPHMQFLDNFCNIMRGNGSPHGNWSAQFQSGVAMCALTLLADPDPLPAAEPDLAIARLSPPADLEIKPGTPVLPRGGTRQILDFLAAGPFDLGMGNDGLAELGGVAKARPTEGTKFKLKVKEEPTRETWDGLHCTVAQRRPQTMTKGDNLAPLVKEIEGEFRRMSSDTARKTDPPDADTPGKGAKGAKQALAQDLERAAMTEEQREAAEEKAEQAAEAASDRRVAGSIAPWEYRIETPGKPAKPSGLVDLWVAMGMRSWRTIYFYAVLDNPKPCYVRVGMRDQQRWDPCVYIAGRRFERNDIVFMEPGKYPVMIPWTMTTYWWYRSHGRDEQVTDFVLSEVTPEDVERLNRHHAAINGFRKACRETLRARDRESPLPDIDALMWLAHSRFVMDRWSSVATGDRGWLISGECFGRISLMTAIPFSHGYGNAMGVNSAWRPNLGWVVPQAVYRTVFSDDGAIMQSYGRGGGPLGVDLWARGFGLVSDDLKAMSLWGWKRTQALADAGKLKAPEIVADQLDPMSAAFAFVNWPDPNSGIVEKNPAECAPRAVADTRMLGYTLRNGWKDKDDIVTILAGFRHPGGEWGSAMNGEWRLAGLGAEWAVHPAGMASNAPTIHILDRFDREVRERYAQFQPDGSGVMGIEWKNGKGEVRAVRHFAVDYSGVCGSPALLVTVDRLPPPPADAVKAAAAAHREAIASIPPPKGEFGQAPGVSDSEFDLDLGETRPKRPTDPEGAKLAAQADLGLLYDGTNRWTLCTMKENKVDLSKNGFTVRAPNGATLAGTVVAPSAPKMETHDDSIGKFEINYWKEHRYDSFTRRVVNVGGGDLIIVAMTLQKGEAPKVTASVKGERAEIRIGGRVVAFDGKRLNLDAK
jgi:hypothetical protein